MPKLFMYNNTISDLMRPKLLGLILANQLTGEHRQLSPCDFNETLSDR
jgi:hypothetical protein